MNYQTVWPKIAAGDSFRAAEEGPLPLKQDLDGAIEWVSQHSSLSADGLGEDATTEAVISKILPALPNHDAGYYGFVIGGVTPAARVADQLVAWADTNVASHLPAESVSTVVESAALKMVVEMLDLDPQQWTDRTFTSGATASNIMGLACGREYVVPGSSVAELGLLKACRQAGIDDIQVISCQSHSSVAKAASVVGLGRTSVVQDPNEKWYFHIEHLEHTLKSNQKARTASIVVAQFGEVNTGGFTNQMAELRRMCDAYGAWLHVDGAFGMYITMLAKSKSKFASQAASVTGELGLADSIGGDGHKTLNVPYDCGVFLCRHGGILQQIFANAGAAYLKEPKREETHLINGFDAMNIPSPLNIGIENSRRFRALPVYASLVAYGRQGYCDFLDRVVQFCRNLAEWIHNSDSYELLVDFPESVWMVVLFRARDAAANADLKTRINASRKVYVTGTVWAGSSAVRVAPCNWNIKTGEEQAVIDVLRGIAG